jgi:hypothetical protein
MSQFVDSSNSAMSEFQFDLPAGQFEYLCGDNVFEKMSSTKDRKMGAMFPVLDFGRKKCIKCNYVTKPLDFYVCVNCDPISVCLCCKLWNRQKYSAFCEECNDILCCGCKQVVRTGVIGFTEQICHRCDFGEPVTRSFEEFSALNVALIRDARNVSRSYNQWEQIERTVKKRVFIDLRRSFPNEWRIKKETVVNYIHYHSPFELKHVEPVVKYHYEYFDGSRVAFPKTCELLDQMLSVEVIAPSRDNRSEGVSRPGYFEEAKDAILSKKFDFNLAESDYFVFFYQNLLGTSVEETKLFLDSLLQDSVPPKLETIEEEPSKKVKVEDPPQFELINSNLSTSLSSAELSKLDYFIDEKLTNDILDSDPEAVVVMNVEKMVSEVGNSVDVLDAKFNKMLANFDREDSAMLESRAEVVCYNDVLGDLDRHFELNAKAVPFVPRYTPTSSLQQLEDLIMTPAVDDDVFRTILIEKGYPQFWIDRALSMRTSGTKRLAQLREISGRRLSGFEPTPRHKSTKYRAVQFNERPNYVKGSKCIFRILPRPGSPYVEKPQFATNYNPAQFMAWVHGKAWLLYQSIPTPRKFVTGNYACEVLFKNGGTAASKMQLQSLIEKADVFIDDYKWIKEREPHVRRILLSEFIPDIPKARRSLMVFGTQVFTTDDLVKFEAGFRRHKNFYRLAVRYLSGDEEVIREVLQSNLNNLVLVEHAQGGINTKLEVAAPAPVQVNHSFDFVGQSDGVERVVIQVALLLTQVATSSSFSAAMLAVGQFVAGNTQIYGLLKAAAYKVFVYTHIQGDETPEHWWTRPLETFKENLINPVWEAVVGCSVISFITELCSSVSNQLCIPLMDFVKTLRVSIFKEGATTLAKSVIQGITEVVARIRECVRQRSLVPIWGQKWDPEAWFRTAEVAILHYSDLVVAPGATVDSKVMLRLREARKIPIDWFEPVTLPQYCGWVEDHIEQGIRLLDYFKTQATICSRLNSARLALLRHLEIAKIGLTSGNIRMAPMFVFLYGKTGVGKSNLQQAIPKAVARMRGYDETSSGVYDWMKESNFQHLGPQHWCVRIDDPGHGVAPLQAGVRNEVEEIIALVNNAPYPVEQADASMKGKVFGYPVMVLVSSNYFTMRASSLTRYPPAFFRRISYHVEVEVKPEFSNGSILDVDKANEAGTHDMFIFKVRRFDPSLLDEANPHKVCLSEPVDMSFPQFLKEMHMGMEDHIRLQRLVVQRACARGQWCPECGLDADRDCGHGSIIKFGVTENEALLKMIEQTQGWCTDVKDTAAFLTTYAIGKCKRIAMPSFDIRSFFTKVYTDIALERAAFGLSVVGGVAGCISLLILATKYLTLTFQGRENNTTEGFIPSSWQRAVQAFTPRNLQAPLLTTYTKDDLIKSITDSHVMVQGIKYLVHGYLVGHNTCVVPTHVLTDSPTVIVKYNGKEVIVDLSEKHLKVRDFPSNPELSLLTDGMLFGSSGIMSRIWPIIDDQVQQFDEVEIWSDKLEYKPTVATMSVWRGSRVLTTNSKTKVGDCGMLYVCRFNTSWRVVAMHYLLLEHASMLQAAVVQSVGAILMGQEIERLGLSITATVQGVRIVSDTFSFVPQQLVCRPLEYRSELWSAMSSHGADPYVLGEMFPKLSGNTAKSKIKKSLIHDDIKDLEELWCGQKDYWRIPDFRGFMKDDKWHSLYSACWVAQNQVSPPLTLMIVAVADYLFGIEDLYAEGYSELSEEQTLSGIPASYIHSVNSKTSMGPPFNRSKQNFIAVQSGNSFMDPAVFGMIDNIQKVLDAGEVPSVMGLCTGKDEPIKPDKFPRVFTCLPFAFNFLLKKKGAWKAFMRANWRFFESTVGVNMTSIECTYIVRFLAQIDPHLQNLYDGDARTLDKSWNGHLWNMLAIAVYCISYAIRVCPKENYLLMHGLKHTTYSIKNDLFRPFWNPSGHDSTVECNGILISVGERMVWYKNNPNDVDVDACVKWFLGVFDKPTVPDCGFTFRKNNALVTYGDDNVKSNRKPPPISYCDDWKSLTGVHMTDPDKTGMMKLRPISEISYLKRNFVFDEELQLYLPPLSLKSMARMLLMKRDSTLTDIDHCAVVSSEAMREAVYHGEEFYNMLRSRLDLLAHKYGFFVNAYYVSRDYSFWRQKLKEGNFQSWQVRVTPSPIAWDEWHF